MLKVLILVTLSFACPSIIHCQHKDSQQAWLATQNVLSGGLISGIGGGINRVEGESFWKGFGNGFKYGCLGGLGLYLGKKLIYPVNSKDQLLYGWPSKLIHSAGMSIIENAGKGEAPFSKWHTNVGFFRLELNLKSANKFNLKVMPFSLGEFAYGLSTAKLEVNSTLLSGTPVFTAPTDFFLSNQIALAGYNAIYIHQDLTLIRNKTIAHELIHILQYNEELKMNVWLTRPTQKIKTSLKNNFVKRVFVNHVYYDIPYQSVLNVIFKSSERCYFKNPLELEAEHFSTNKYIRKCD